ncbi:MAG: helix-turn-helix transcriptional regulator [Chloroflexota bacterium]
MNAKSTEAVYTQELRRGVIVLAVLSQLSELQYGYSLITQLAELGFAVDQGTLYPLLRRLEDRGLLESEWVVGESRPRRYYKISPAGEKAYTDLKSEWQELVKTMQEVIK